MELWLRSYLEKVPFERPPGDGGTPRNAEAALCSQTLFWEAGGQIQRAAYQADLLAQGLAPERHGALLAWIAQEQPVLLAARQMVWRSQSQEAPRQSDRPVPGFGTKQRTGMVSHARP